MTIHDLSPSRTGSNEPMIQRKAPVVYGRTSPDNISDIPRVVLMFVYNRCDNALHQPYWRQSPRPEYLRNPDATAINTL